MKRISFLQAACLFILGLFVFSACQKDDDDDLGEELRIRKNAKDLTAEEKADYVNAILALKATPSPYIDSLSYYDTFVRFHQMAVERRFCSGTSVAHANPAFPAWHRKLLMLYEDALREVSGKDISLPYWDWTDDASTDATFASDLMGGSGDPAEEYALLDGPFKKGAFEINLFTIRPDYKLANPHPWIVRNFKAVIPGDRWPGYEVNLPTLQEVENCLNISTYDVTPWDCSGARPANTSFRFCLEGFTGEECAGQQAIHNIGHDWIAGFFLSNDGTGDMIPVETVIPECGMIMRDTVPDNIRVGSMEPLDVSPNDPAFFMHHCNVDRVWWEWQQLPGNAQKYEPMSGAPQGYNLNDEMYPYDIPSFQGKGTMNSHGLTPNSMLSAEDLGYFYE